MEGIGNLGSLRVHMVRKKGEMEREEGKWNKRGEREWKRKGGQMDRERGYEKGVK